MKLRIYLSVILLFFLSACSTRERGGPLAENASPQNIPALDGAYAVNGIDNSDVEYGGRLTINVTDTPGVHDMLWILTGIIQEGTGVVNGNQLGVVWRTVEGSARISSGSAQFTITTAGEFYGIKTVEGYEGEGTETAYPNSPENMSGDQ